MAKNDSSVNFLYGNAFGRFLLKTIQKTHADRLAVWFLRSSLSRCIIRPFARSNGIPEEEWLGKHFRSYREFFIRKKDYPIDENPNHLISPADSWLSVFPVAEDSSFSIKASHYSLKDLLQDQELARTFHGGDCLIFRLCASDYHHYCYIDDAYVGENHFIPGQLHSVQPIACETFPVYTLNRRSWVLLTTEHFGPVVQTEIGALVVGGIYNDHENRRVCRGMEKGHFELAGSTIVLLFRKGQLQLLPEIAEATKNGEEYRVTYGAQIGTASEGVK